MNPDSARDWLPGGGISLGQLVGGWGERKVS